MRSFVPITILSLLYGVYCAPLVSRPVIRSPGAEKALLTRSTNLRPELLKFRRLHLRQNEKDAFRFTTDSQAAANADEDSFNTESDESAANDDSIALAAEDDSSTIDDATDTDSVDPLTLGNESAAASDAGDDAFETSDDVTDVDSTSTDDEATNSEDGDSEVADGATDSTDDSTEEDNNVDGSADIDTNTNIDDSADTGSDTNADDSTVTDTDADETVVASNDTGDISGGTGDDEVAGGSGDDTLATQGARTTVNAATLNLVKSFEGFEPSPKPDPVGFLTVGFGHKCIDQKRCSEVPFSFPLSRANADALILSDMQEGIDCVNNEVTVPLNDNQFGALASFSFNGGCGLLRSSTLLKRLNAGENPNTVVAAELPKFNKATDQKTGKKIVLAGLTRRRAAEASLFQTPP